MEEAKKELHELKEQLWKEQEAIEIMKFPQNLNRGNGTEISGHWLPLIRQINPSKPFVA